MQPVRIINRGRGPEIAGTRITVYHIWEFYREGDHRDDIAQTFNLSFRQVQAAMDYIDEHREEVEREYAKIRARIPEPNPEQIEKTRARMTAYVQQLREQREHQV